MKVIYNLKNTMNQEFQEIILSAIVKASSDRGIQIRRAAKPQGGKRQTMRPGDEAKPIEACELRRLVWLEDVSSPDVWCWRERDALRERRGKVNGEYRDASAHCDNEIDSKQETDSIWAEK
jgi:hypothetical protein